LKDSTNIIFRTHAIQRMFQRNISEKDVRSILMKGETIEEYADDTPYPSRLILGWIGQKPFHVVAADNDMDKEIIIITVYEPDREKWSDDFKRRTI
jgi:Domain of unknown function (DUF4258)